MMPTASHLHNLKQALGTYRRALEEFESALLELEEAPMCEVCGEALTAATRRDAKTCSAACRQKAYRRRRAQHLTPYRVGAGRFSEKTPPLGSSVSRGKP
jgi:predicted nucleic acid-binding Zn ribbon protein